MIFSVLGFLVISLFLIASLSFPLFWPQAVFYLIGIIVFLIFSSIDHRFWRKYSFFLYLFSVSILLFSLLSSHIRGARRWIEIAGVNFQPSELIKPLIIVILANILANEKKYSLKGLGKRILLFLPIVLIIFEQPDLGSLLVYVSIFIGMEIASGLPWKYFITFLLLSLLSVPIFWLILRSYQKLRLISFFNPQFDPQGAGYNALQSVIAVGSGKLWGLGLGRGTQSKLLFLPEFSTDFIFAALVESLGFIGGFLVILFYILFLAKILKIAFLSQERFGTMVAIGLFMQFFSQVLINIGMNLGILPITGVTLPFLSYGGSSLLASFLGLGLLSSVSKLYRKSPLVIH